MDFLTLEEITEIADRLRAERDALRADLPFYSRHPRPARDPEGAHTMKCPYCGIKRPETAKHPPACPYFNRAYPR